MTTRTRASGRPAGLTAMIIGAAGVVVASTAAASSPPPEPVESTAPTSTTLAPLRYGNGVFTAPDDSFLVEFGGLPGRTIDEANGIVSYLFGVDGDTQSVVLVPPTAFGATTDSTAGERAEVFLAASGTDIALLANTPTNLGPFPASHFAARLTLSDDRRVIVYGVVVDRGSDVAYAFYTDVGDDSNAAGTAFVQSFTLVMAEPPGPTTTTTTTTAVPTGSEPSPADLPAEVPTESPPGVATTAAPTSTDGSAEPTTTTTPPPPTVAVAPGSALLGFDGRWWITYPDGAVPAFRASTRDGFAYAEYLAVVGDDTLTVTVTEVPPGYQWQADGAPAAAAGRIGGEVLESRLVDIAGRPAVRFTLVQPDSDTSGDTVEMLVVDGGDRVYSVAYQDGGVSSTSAADEFIESFGLA